jgi:hypothetical protein
MTLTANGNSNCSPYVSTNSNSNDGSSGSTNSNTNAGTNGNSNCSSNGCTNGTLAALKFYKMDSNVKVKRKHEER